MAKNVRKYSKLKFTNDFMFAKIMRNKEICKRLLEIILGIKIERIEYPEEQKSIDITAHGHGVRLDVYVMDDKNTVYNVEMQATNPKNLPKRSRYYQGMIDLNLIEKGEEYSRLKKSYVIFICSEDIFGKGLPVYTFENICLQDKQLHLNDDTIKVFLNPIADMNRIDGELKNFLLYIANGNPIDDFTKQIENEVVAARANKEWEVEYMNLNIREREMYNEGKMDTLFGLVKKGIITIEDAAIESSLSKEEFQQDMKRAEYNNE